MSQNKQLGDFQRFFMGLLFIIPFDVLLIVIAIRVIFVPVSINVENLDVQPLLLILITGLIGIVNSAAAYYFTSKATERAKNSG